MESVQNINIANKFLSPEIKRAETVKFADALVKTVFFFLMDEQEGMFTEVGENLEEINEDVADEFSKYLWEVAASFISAINLNIIGESDGGYIAEFNIPESVKDFLITEDIGKKAVWFYEDMFEDSAEDSSFGLHEDKLDKIFNN